MTRLRHELSKLRTDQKSSEARDERRRAGGKRSKCDAARDQELARPFVGQRAEDWARQHVDDNERGERQARLRVGQVQVVLDQILDGTWNVPMSNLSRSASQASRRVRSRMGRGRRRGRPRPRVLSVARLFTGTSRPDEPSPPLLAHLNAPWTAPRKAYLAASFNSRSTAAVCV
jgi:hypothetical protein